MSEASASETLVAVKKETKAYDLTAVSRFCIDRDNKTEAEDLFPEYTPPKCSEEIPGQPYGYTSATVWIRTLLHSGPGDPQRWIVELDNALLDDVDLYIVQNGEIVSHFQSGDKRPFASRPIVSRNFRFPVILPPSTTTTLIWKIRSASSIDLPITLYEPHYLQEKDKRDFLYYGIFYGILIILALYNFVFFLIFRKSVYLFYVGFILFYALMQLSFDGLASLLLWPDHPWLYNDGVPFFVNLAIMAAVLFGQRFLETSICAPKTHRLLNIILLINLVPMFLSFFDYYYITVKLTTLLAAVTPPVLIAAGIATFGGNKRRSRFYLGAWSLFFIGSVFLALHKLGLLPPWWIVMHAQQFGVLFKILVLSYALGDQLQSLLFVDRLTGLGNRYSLERVFASAVHYAKKGRLPFAVISIDIDDFKTINDSLTHKAGDELLKLLAERLQTYLHRYDTILRMGQDEFIILLENITMTENLSIAADRLLAVIREPFTLDRHTIHITASMGIALYPNDGTDYDTMAKNSDSALQKAKELGKNRFHFFNPDLDSTAVKRMKLYNDLYKALENREFFLLYQPKINARDDTLAGVEVLLRWYHPELGVITPDLFIGFAEEKELITRITWWVMEETCKMLKRWAIMGDTVFAAVNVTAKDLNRKFFVSDISDLCKQYGIGMELLELELTERTIAEASAGIAKNIAALHDMGIKIAIDDFGTGYSTFSYLKSFQVNTIKIDKSFVDAIETDPKMAKIIKAITSLSHELGLKVVVEGVENAFQVRMLRKIQCDLFQGYFFDKPLTAAELTAKYFHPNTQPKTTVAPS